MPCMGHSILIVVPKRVSVPHHSCLLRVAVGAWPPAGALVSTYVKEAPLAPGCLRAHPQLVQASVAREVLDGLFAHWKHYRSSQHSHAVLHGYPMVSAPPPPPPPSGPPTPTWFSPHGFQLLPWTSRGVLGPALNPWALVASGRLVPAVPAAGLRGARGANPGLCTSCAPRVHVYYVVSHLGH